jgi:tungstate transport system substrate-binding protein
MSEPLFRRSLLRFASAGLLGAPALACQRAAAPPRLAPNAPRAAAPVPVASSTRVRIASVPTAVEGGLLPALLADFEKASGTKVELTVATKDVYDLAREGGCDLILSHYGHRQAEAFVAAGFGEWPRTVFSNQSAIFGPTSDPAGIRGVTDAFEAFARIAKARAPFIVNDLFGQRYVADILWHAAGSPNRDGWWIDPKVNREDVLSMAVEKQGYVMWGLTPFARSQKDNQRALEPLVFNDPILQRLMVTIVVARDKVPGVSFDGAHALQSFLLEPATQAKIHLTKYPGVDHSAWAPAGRHNRYAILPQDAKPT